MTSIHVACCFNAAMQDAAEVLARSIALTTREAHVTLHMLHLPLPGDGIAALKRRMDGPMFTVVAHPVLPAHLPVPEAERRYMATYMRWLLPALLDVERVIYLDCDMLVRRSLVDLYAMDLGGAAVAAVEDMGVTRFMHDNGYPYVYQGQQWLAEAYCREVVGLDLLRDGYLCAGMLVMDLAKWRAQDLAALCFAFTGARKAFVFHDQDALNHVLQGRFARLDQRWNALSFLPPLYADPSRALVPPTGDWAATLAAWVRDPWIIHYAGDSKPWVHPHIATGQYAVYWRVALAIPAGRRMLWGYLLQVLRSLPSRMWRHLLVRPGQAAFGALQAVMQSHPLLRRLRPRTRIIRAWRLLFGSRP